MMTYNGENIFGLAARCRHVANPRAQQVDVYFGVNGARVLDGGGRGRVFQVRGLLVGSTMAELAEAEARFVDYADGQARVFVDTRGRSWSNVIFKGEFTPDPLGPFPISGGWALPYRALFHGLT